MYIPPAFRVESSELLLDFIERYSFATLVSSVAGVPLATHLPLLVERDPPLLLGHVARANPHWRQFESGGEALVIFSGPHAYISPSWYQTRPAVPTWNYAAVHAYGVPRVVGEARLEEIIDRLVAKHESPQAKPWQNDLPSEYRAGLLQGIVGFELPIARLEGKFKLGQNRSQEDQQSMLRRLAAGNPDERALAAFIGAQNGNLDQSRDAIS